jgi:folate-dependent phosphoribosylglycinamide formyltransferase PurN
MFHALDPEGVVLEEKVEGRTMLARRVKKLGAARVAGQVAFHAVVQPWLRWSSSDRIEEIAREQGLDLSPIPAEKIVHVASVNDERCVAALRALAPDIVVVNGTRIIGEALLKSVAAPFVNVHAGITPLYRGVHGGYWALASGDREHCGVTVHQIDKGIDTGAVLAQAVIQPTERDNFATYPFLQLGAGVRLLKEVLARPLQPIAAPAGASRLWSHPTIFEYVRTRLCSGVK